MLMFDDGALVLGGGLAFISQRPRCLMTLIRTRVGEIKGVRTLGPL
jgi:hypothetical protein